MKVSQPADKPNSVSASALSGYDATSLAACRAEAHERAKAGRSFLYVSDRSLTLATYPVALRPR